MSYAKIIKSARINRGLSQEELARRIGVTKGAVSQWESGESTPSRKNQKALANELGIKASELEAMLSSGLSLLDTLPEGREIPFIDWRNLSQLDFSTSSHKAAIRADGLSGGVVVVDGDTPTDAIAASVEDDSMAPEYHPGDVIIFSHSVAPRAGDAVVAAVPDGHVLRRYSPRGLNRAGEAVYDLVSSSPDFDTISSSSAKLLGVVIEHRRKRR